MINWDYTVGQIVRLPGWPRRLKILAIQAYPNQYGPGRATVAALSAPGCPFATQQGWGSPLNGLIIVTTRREYLWAR